MRLWSLHPKYLDRAGLLALWREALLAQKVLMGATRGYRHHPQLIRFKHQPRPKEAIASYLAEIWEESSRRGYRFDRRRIGSEGITQTIPVTRGQLKYESSWLCCKLQRRDPDKYRRLCSVQEIEPHPLFRVVEGEIEAWERTETPALSEADTSQAGG